MSKNHRDVDGTRRHLYSLCIDVDSILVCSWTSPTTPTNFLEELHLSSPLLLFEVPIRIGASQPALVVLLPPARFTTEISIIYHSLYHSTRRGILNLDKAPLMGTLKE
ncbi:hypothetical protein PAXRUDRAFT_761651 [Paxillus rubicundulus Ve08.2h10]|uniref:Uncharacterized protein n=1 Tax=Paxillus rubicundulus Ve08.2h10 TaxID=930991 RepID=A0A0D0DIG8_9AGAM|nr:hypothetical protein PAXRUDRAFT_761651 [Paxillus rubicundulus Ve08.2h10]